MQALRVETVHSLASALLDAHEPRRREDAKMPCCSWPAAPKSAGDLSGSHFSASITKDKENLSARRVCKRGEHGVQIREFSFKLRTS
jgi:hypothetical protein